MVRGNKSSRIPCGRAHILIHSFIQKHVSIWKAKRVSLSALAAFLVSYSCHARKTGCCLKNDLEVGRQVYEYVLSRFFGVAEFHRRYAIATLAPFPFADIHGFHIEQSKLVPACGDSIPSFATTRRRNSWGIKCWRRGDQSNSTALPECWLNSLATTAALGADRFHLDWLRAGAITAVAFTVQNPPGVVAGGAWHGVHGEDVTRPLAIGAVDHQRHQLSARKACRNSRSDSINTTQGVVKLSIARQGHRPGGDFKVKKTKTPGRGMWGNRDQGLQESDAVIVNEREQNASS